MASQDLPSGLQTHIYAAAGVDLRHKYSSLGNQPGEMLEAWELGSDALTSGLYLKEDKQIMCNTLILSFMGRQLREATDVLIARLVKNAELVDAERNTTLEDGKPKTTDPKNRRSVNFAASPLDLSSDFPPPSN